MSSESCIHHERPGTKHLSFMMILFSVFGVIQLCLGLAPKPTALLPFSGRALRWDSKARESSCLHLPATDIIGVTYHTQVGIALN